MRMGFSLGSTAIQAVGVLKDLLYGDAPVQNGYIIGCAYKKIRDHKNIDWVAVNQYEKVFLSEHGDGKTIEQRPR
jgi:hypothetical protein